jgi:excisionase family DNA binding protein
VKEPSASAVAAVVAALDPTTTLFLGNIPANGHISVAQAADVLDVSRSRVYELLRAGDLTSKTICGRTTLQICDVVSARRPSL